MGFFSDVGSFASGLFGKSVDYDVARKLQHDAQDWNEEFYGKRHQLEVADLRAAGLNPILSVMGSAGGSSSGIASAAGMSDVNLNSALAEKARSEAKVAARQADVLSHQISSARSKAETDKISLGRLKNVVSKVDQSEIGKEVGHAIDALPPWLAGVGRFGVAAAEGVKNTIANMRAAVGEGRSTVGGKGASKGSETRLDSLPGRVLKAADSVVTDIAKKLVTVYKDSWNKARKEVIGSKYVKRGEFEIVELRSGRVLIFRRGVLVSDFYND